MSKHQIQPEYVECKIITYSKSKDQRVRLPMNRPTRDGTTEPISRDHIIRREQGQGNIHFLCSAEHDEQEWQPHPVDSYFAIYYMSYIHTYIQNILSTAIGSASSSSGLKIAYRWRSLPRVRRLRASSPQGSSSNNGCCLLRYPHRPIFERLSFPTTTIIGEVDMTMSCDTQK